LRLPLDLYDRGPAQLADPSEPGELSHGPDDAAAMIRHAEQIDRHSIDLRERR
jgi:hypothetical protein